MPATIPDGRYHIIALGRVSGTIVETDDVVGVNPNFDWPVPVVDDIASDAAAIKAKTDNLPSDPADASVIAARFDTVDSSLAAISAVTGSFSFTVPGFVDANVQYVNDIQVVGTGATGDEWGPA